MEVSEKKKLSNEKRLKAVQQWQKQRESRKVEGKPVHLKFDSAPTIEEKKNSQLKLFEDSEGDDENNEHDFSIKPQFEGHKGLKNLEMSSQFSDRFKLDERFIDDGEPSIQTQENEEKAKNMKILESILGHEVREKYPEGKSSSKRQLQRFDPEDETTSKFVVEKEEVAWEKAPKKKKSKKNIPIVAEEIPISKERYIEVSSDLKSILSSSTQPFSLSQRFGNSNDVIDEGKDKNEFSLSSSSQEKISPQVFESASNTVHAETFPQNLRKPIDYKSNFRDNFSFFITENDLRLKEGVEFFQIPKSLDEVREDWNSKRNSVLELFKTKRKSNSRRFSHKPNASQRNKLIKRN